MRAILLIDHGSRRAEANEVVEDVAAMLRASHESVIVVAAHMELALPTVAEGFAACVAAGATEVIVVPYFLGPGRHVSADVPRLVEAAATSHEGVSVRITAPLGADERIAALIALRAEID